MVNARDGGVNGVKFTYEKCETSTNTRAASSCYERTKARTDGRVSGDAAVDRITYSLIDKGTADHIPIVSIGYGRTDASDGRVFPMDLPLITTTGARTPPRSSSSPRRRRDG